MDDIVPGNRHETLRAWSREQLAAAMFGKFISPPRKEPPFPMPIDIAD
jgi:hypothetical protein